MTHITLQVALELYAKLQEVRHFESRTAQLYRAGELPGFIHVSLGQEACAAGACMALRESDIITSTHRGHGHCIAKGADPRFMMAELFARDGGYSRGRGGSMHIADMSKGILGANGIVGQSVPLALGAALTAQTLGKDQIALAFFGEGASGAGPTLESMNIAGIWKLPVILFCEVNRYCEFMPFASQSAIPNLADRASGFGFPGRTIDGNDALAVFEAVSEAADLARRGGGPTFIEAKTHRWHGHYEGDPLKTMTPDDLDADKRIDPLPRFATFLRKTFGVEGTQLDGIEKRAANRIEEAIVFARALEPPLESFLYEVVYA
jgi:pyruvate dehydrogenase E1 component alpha subunit